METNIFYRFRKTALSVLIITGVITACSENPFEDILLNVPVYQCRPPIEKNIGPLNNLGPIKNVELNQHFTINPETMRRVFYVLHSGEDFCSEMLTIVVGGVNLFEGKPIIYYRRNNEKSVKVILSREGFISLSFATNHQPTAVIGWDGKLLQVFYDNNYWSGYSIYK